MSELPGVLLALCLVSHALELLLLTPVTLAVAPLGVRWCGDSQHSVGVMR